MYLKGRICQHLYQHHNCGLNCRNGVSMAKPAGKEEPKKWRVVACKIPITTIYTQNPHPPPNHHLIVIEEDHYLWPLTTEVIIKIISGDPSINSGEKVYVLEITKNQIELTKTSQNIFNLNSTIVTISLFYACQDPLNIPCTSVPRCNIESAISHYQPPRLTLPSSLSNIENKTKTSTA